MIVGLVGHRGTGKTSLLQRVKGYYEAHGKAFRGIDLDSQIEAFSGLSVADLFASEGEKGFRSLESRVFQQILREAKAASADTWIAIGAGFAGPIPSHVHVLWVCRPTDHRGRIFLDRPRLESGVSPLSEFAGRAAVRQEAYRLRADDIYEMQEGMTCPSQPEEALLMGHLGFSGGVLTVLPWHLRSDGSLRDGLVRQAQSGMRLEARDDLLSESEWQSVHRQFGNAPLLLSVRCPDSYLLESPNDLRESLADGLWDWALELGSPAIPRPDVVSLHTRHPGESVRRAGDRLAATAQETGATLKLAVEIGDFAELREGHDWYEQAPQRRVFLPRSDRGRWAWYRLWHKDRFALNFVRNGQGSATDQPSLIEWVGFDFQARGFAAILGQPVDHSHTPAEQAEFFRQFNMPVLRIDASDSDFDVEALEFCRRLGLRAAAVTSPLKPRLFELCGYHTPEATRMGAVNTIVWSDLQAQWIGHNTDAAGFRALAEHVSPDDDVVVWGGGGTREVIRANLPQAQFYSARKGGDPSRRPTVVVWAVPRGRVVGDPPPSWLPRTVLDLSYAHDSPGRAYALRLGCLYVDGLAMFRLQANLQRAFWEKHVR